MEIGNLCFGHSRGNYPVPRFEGYEDELKRLFESYAPKGDSYWREYGEDFENDVFEVHPYYWDDCTCGFEEKDWKWSEDNKCSETCFTVRLKAFEEELKKTTKWLSAKYISAVNEWAKENGWPAGWSGAAVHCDCGVNDAYQRWRKENNHSDQCLLLRPNFRFKPTGYTLMWYKYPLRDSYQSENLTLSEFRSMIDACIASVK